MPAAKWSEEQRESALLALHDGATLGEVHAETGIPKGTLASWKRRQGEAERLAMIAELDTPLERAEAAARRREQTAAARQHNTEVNDESRKQLAGRLLDEVHGLLDRINAPTTYKHVKVVNQGEGMGSTVEVVDVDLDLPTPTDTKALVTSAAILIDKLQLLTGEATERTAHMGAGVEVDLDAEWKALQEEAARVAGNGA